MNSKATRPSLILLALLLAALWALSLAASGKGYENLLLAAPSAFGTPGLDVGRLEEFIEEEFLLTYEIPSPGNVQALNRSHSVALVGTNPHYAGLLGYPVLDGGFFTQAAMNAKSRHAVLGETAAHAIFGSGRIADGTFKLGGESWTVVGVVRDGDEDGLNLYVPATVVGGRAGSIMARVEGAVTETYAKNALKALGVHDSGYDLISLSKSTDAFGQRFSVAWRGVLAAAVLLLVLALWARLPERLRFYRGKLEDLYFRELFIRYRGDILKTAFGLLLIAAGVGAILALSLQILAVCLAWQEIPSITDTLVTGDFGRKLQWLRDWQTAGWVLFGGCVGLIPVCFLLARTGRGFAKALWF